MASYRITALPVGTTRVPAAEVYWMAKLAGWENLTFWSFLIEGEGRRVLLNTGFPRDVGPLHRHWTGWAKAVTGEEGHVPVVRPEDQIDQVLRRRGIGPEGITDILVTPLTAYATGGLNRFPAAQIWLSRHGWLDFQAPDPEVPQLPRQLVFPPEVLHYLTFDGAERLNLIGDDTSEPLPGIKAWFCGGHHRSSLCFLVPTPLGRVALTDAIFHFRNFEESIPLGLSESVEEHYRLYARLRREADLVIPLYEPGLADRYPSLVLG